MTLNESDATALSDKAAFGQLLQSLTLGASERSSIDTRNNAISKMYSFFSYECTFVYELNTSSSLLLRERAGKLGNTAIPESLSLTAVLPPELKQLARLDQFCCFDFSDNTTPQSALISQLKIKGLAVVLLTDDEGELIGCVGMADTREHPKPPEDTISLMNIAFTPITEKVRLRVYHQRLTYTSKTLESIMDHIGFDIYVNDYDSHELLYANRSMAQPYGGWEAMRGKKCF